jgi:hypothetical protein
MENFNLPNRPKSEEVKGFSGNYQKNITFKSFEDVYKKNPDFLEKKEELLKFLKEADVSGALDREAFSLKVDEYNKLLEPKEGHKGDRYPLERFEQKYGGLEVMYYVESESFELRYLKTTVFMRLKRLGQESRNNEKNDS